MPQLPCWPASECSDSTLPYARLHAAGKASPVAFLIASLGAGIQLGFPGAAALAIAGAAMILTLPVGVHLLFRAVHRTQRQPASAHR